MADVYINAVDGKPDYASLPVAKVICYPLEKRDYRPYVQAQFTLDKDALTCRLLSFEAQPEACSRISVVLRLGSADACAFTYAFGEPDAQPGPMGIRAQARRIAGEDLQGVYWGVECQLDRLDLERIHGKPLLAGESLYGNVYKTCTGPDAQRPHFGCLFKSRVVSFPPPDGTACLGGEDLGELKIVHY